MFIQIFFQFFISKTYNLLLDIFKPIVCHIDYDQIFKQKHKDEII